MSLQLLLVEDDIDLANGIIEFLELEDIECDFASDGQTGLNLALANQYDIIVLDINLPMKSGLEVCQKLRDMGNDTPILMLTAQDTMADKLKGFDCGTDDYLVKPFDIQELFARIRVQARRRSTQSKKLCLDDFCLDLTMKQATRAGVNIELGAIGWKIVEILLRQSPNPVSRQQLEQEIWQDDFPDKGALKVHIFRLRSKIDKPFGKPLIHTVVNQGFAMRVNDED
ncbi:response regulator transcription factor [Psychrobium sp. MM17-31]|uniref:response regulator transcription factor n=1 Tax=Psychrobium sp. MM17-31 TaxID=2917758 RepID=UPI001EF57341|nr:response regulator transcription factor [Psychrobium sp. MM17-31]